MLIAFNIYTNEISLFSTSHELESCSALPYGTGACGRIGVVEERRGSLRTFAFYLLLVEFVFGLGETGRALIALSHLPNPSSVRSRQLQS